MIELTAKAVKEWNALWHPAKNILKEVLCERIVQDKRWGTQDHDMADYYTILGEEFGEVGKAICEYKLQRKVPIEQIRLELIQTAAVAIAMIESLDRNRA